MTTAEELTIRKSVVVATPIERAFEIFTEGAGGWWPFATHSIHGDDVETVVFERRPGGRVYERTHDGREAEWGSFLAWEPPSRIVLEWTVDPRYASEVEVRFTADGDGTRVELEHRGWERYADEAEQQRSNYDRGWDFVLGKYVESVRP